MSYKNLKRSRDAASNILLNPQTKTYKIYTFLLGIYLLAIIRKTGVNVVSLMNS